VATEKLSATVDADVLARVRAAAGRRGLSAFVDRALRRELERVELQRFLAELEAQLGPPDPALVAEAEAMLDAIPPSPRPRKGARRRASAA
jgi:Arc/MetJ family transcription regulator